MDTQTELNLIKQEIQKLNDRLDLLKSSTTIPLEVGEAFRKRLQPVAGDSSSTSASTYTRAVNEGGSGTYNVAMPMTGFITIVVNGNSRQVPYY